MFFKRSRIAAAVVIAMAFAWLTGGPAVVAQVQPKVPVFADGVSLGDPAAPVTLQAYISYGCSHCQAWFKDVYPGLKRKYIDTGKVRLVVVEFTAGHRAMARAGAIAARCAPRAKYFKVAEALYGQTPTLLGGENDDGQPRIDTETWVEDALKAAGVTPREMKACDAAAQQAALEDRMTRAMADYPGYRGGTPAFVANGQPVEADTLDWAEYAIAVMSEEAGHPLTSPEAHDLFCVGRYRGAVGPEEPLEVRWSFERGLWRLAGSAPTAPGKPVVHAPGGIPLSDGKHDFLLGDDGIPRLANAAPGETYEGRCGMLAVTPIPG